MVKWLENSINGQMLLFSKILNNNYVPALLLLYFPDHTAINGKVQDFNMEGKIQGLEDSL